MVAREVFENLSNVAAVEGRGFISLTFEENVGKEPPDDTINKLIENPAGSGTFVILSAPIVTSDRAVDGEGVKNVTKDVAGVTEETLNQRTDGVDTSIANVESGVEWSGGTSFGIEQTPGGGFSNTVGFTTEDDAIVIAPGDNFLLETTNASPATIDIGIKFKFAETHEKNLPTAWSP